MRLEAQIRARAGQAFAADRGRPESNWAAAARELELERLRIIGRCRLEEDTDDAVQADLALAAESAEELLRQYNLLYARFEKSGRPEAEATRNAALRALEAVKSR